MKTTIDQPEFEKMSGMNGSTGKEDKDTGKGITIFGMKPYVAGIVAIAVVGIVYFVTKKLIK